MSSKGEKKIHQKIKKKKSAYLYQAYGPWMTVDHSFHNRVPFLISMLFIHLEYFQRSNNPEEL